MRDGLEAQGEFGQTPLGKYREYLQRTENGLGDVSPDKLIEVDDASRQEQSWAHFRRTGLYEEGGEDTVDLFVGETPQERLEKF